MAQRVAHWVKPNEACRIPRRHIFLDSEALSTREAWGEQQKWRLAVAGFYSAEKGRKVHDRTDVFATPEALWLAVDVFTGRRSRTVLWCHNLAYDLRITTALPTLVAHGWTLISYNLRRRGTWLVWRKNDATLVMVDSSSVFPATLGEVGKKFGMSKRKLPNDAGTEAEWENRCRDDVAILRTAVLAYLTWLEREDLGNWQMTGAGQAWAAFRHRHLTHKMLVHSDEGALVMERRAMWTGRCEAFWHGTMLRQVLHEWDMTNAYATIASQINVPTKLIGPFGKSYNWKGQLDNARVAVLADCDVTTSVPVVPALREGYIAWPTGTFRTVLWGAEIRLALNAGATVSVHGGYLYRAEPALRSWGHWVLDSLSADDSVIPAWQKMIYKHWVRALPGRLGMQYSHWEPFGRLPQTAVRHWECIDVHTKDQYSMMQVGHDVWREAGVEEWSQSMPAITGSIMAELRARMWHLLSALPEHVGLYCDTDSIFVTDRHLTTMRELAAAHPQYGLRLKRSWDGFGIYGPRQLVTGNLVRISGIPVHAKRTGRHTFQGEVWESIEKATKEGRFSTVRIRPRQWTMQGVDRRRDGPAIGWTKPVTMGVEVG